MPEPAQLLRESWKAAVALGDEVPLLFYGVLFDLAPHVADLFPPDMREQRRHLIATLGVMVKTHGADRDQWQPTADRLRQLGKDHRRYGAEPEHYPVVAQALLETLGHFMGRAWTPEHERVWTDAISTVAEVMADAADEETCPAWLDLEIERVDRSPWLASFLVAPPAVWPERYGREVWLRRTDRPSGWVKGTVSDPATAVIPLEGLDAIVLSQTPEGAQLRLAPVYELETP